MRKNFPVTEIEYSVSDETLIVSKTDLKGKLTYFNEDFLAAAGFTSAELMGQPHNIVRHPDMPPEAFDNLWDTLKAGKPWLGAVKNRRKNGDFYWVLATASPIRENGQVTGFTSIRTKLPVDQRKLAEEVYAAIRDKKSHGYRIDAGIIRRRSLLDRFSVFTKTLKARLVTMMSVQALFMLALGIGGALWANGSASMILSLLAVVGAAIGGFVGLATMRAIQGPMQQLNDTLVNLVQDKMDNRIVIARDDEIGEALRNLQTVQTIIRFSRDEVQAVQRRAEVQRKADMTASRARSARSSRPCRRPQPSSRLLPRRCPPPRSGPRAWRQPSPPAPKRHPPTSIRWRRPRKRCLPPSARSAARCRTRRGSPTRPSPRRKSLPTASASCRGRRPGSATSSSSSMRSRARPICWR
jgi:aerotaxis receptor